MEKFRPIEFSTYINRPLSEVYESLITTKGWNGCFTTDATIDLDKREIHFRWKNLGPHKIEASAFGKIIEFKKNQSFSFNWHFESLPEPTEVSFSFEPKGQGTILTVKDVGYPKTEDGEFMYMDCSAGWAEFLTLLKVFLETGYRYQNW